MLAGKSHSLPAGLHAKDIRILEPNGGFATLFDSTWNLLAQGGDERLDVSAGSGANRYGCTARPRKNVIALSSATASTISERAYKRAMQAQQNLAELSAAHGFEMALDVLTESARDELRTHLGLRASDCDVIFSPSGTDAQLLIRLFANQALGSPITTLVVGSDQTGSGTVFTAKAASFGWRTARGTRVVKGCAILGAGENARTIELPFIDGNGQTCHRNDLDDQVFQTVQSEIENGRSVVLFAMNASKFGWRAPSDSCLARLAQHWRDDVLIVIDACQARIGRPRLGTYLRQGYVVLLTGSKFFTGPAFSGAILVPTAKSLCHHPTAPAGLSLYADRLDIPRRFVSLRGDLPLNPNLGQFLRWQAALEEMRAYWTLPDDYRHDVMTGLARVIPKILAKSPILQLVSEDLKDESADDEEFCVPTIFPFLVRDAYGYLDFDQATNLYETLNGELNSPICRDDADQPLFQPCHIAQPVRLFLDNAVAAAALRIAIGARNLVDAFLPSQGLARLAVRRIAKDVSAVVRRIERIEQSQKSGHTHQ